MKFGYGVYLTCSYKSAAHYSSANKDATHHYVYTVEIPDMAEGNNIVFRKPVNPEIIRRAELKLGRLFPRNSKWTARISGSISPGL